MTAKTTTSTAITIIVNKQSARARHGWTGIFVSQKLARRPPAVFWLYFGWIRLVIHVVHSEDKVIVFRF